MQALDGHLDGLEQVAGIHVVDQVGDDFGVGLALEHVAEGRQFGAQFVVVFNDAVVDQGDTGVLFGRRKVRVRIVRGRRAVGRPAGVRNAGETLQAFAGDLGFQFGHARGAARTLQLAVHVQRHAAGIIAAVFKSLEALDQDRGNVTLSYCSDDSAHGKPQLENE